MTKIDFKREWKHLYKPSPKRVDVVDVPPINYLMVDGDGAPGSPAYIAALETLYPVAYRLKFMAKQGPLATDFVVMPLEGLWWADDPNVFITREKAKWKWTMMIAQPEFITQPMFDAAVETVRKQKGPRSLDLLRFEKFEEGLCAQTLHLGPFSEEGPTVQRVHDFIEARGTLSGIHHEIYLSDIRRANPANWKTIVRQPFVADESLNHV